MKKYLKKGELENAEVLDLKKVIKDWNNQFVLSKKINSLVSGKGDEYTLYIFDKKGFQVLFERMLSFAEALFLIKEKSLIEVKDPFSLRVSILVEESYIENRLAMLSESLSIKEKEVELYKKSIQRLKDALC